MAMGFHAIFGISLDVLGARCWRRTGGTPSATPTTPPCWPTSRRAAAIAWGAGDLPSFMLAIALLVGWFSSDRRESRRH